MMPRVVRTWMGIVASARPGANMSELFDSIVLEICTTNKNSNENTHTRKHCKIDPEPGKSGPEPVQAGPRSRMPGKLVRAGPRSRNLTLSYQASCWNPLHGHSGYQTRFEAESIRARYARSNGSDSPSFLLNLGPSNRSVQASLAVSRPLEAFQNIGKCSQR